MKSQEIEQLMQSRTEEDRKRCIHLLKVNLSSDPGDVESWFQLACCHDFIGQEAEAELCYERVNRLGSEKLSADDRKAFYVGYGSTLRNNMKLDESRSILSCGIREFPDYPSLRVFLALTEYSAGKYQEASLALLNMATALPSDLMDGYERAIGRYVDILRR